MLALIVEVLAVVSNLCGLEAASRAPQPACPRGEKKLSAKWPIKVNVKRHHAKYKRIFHGGYF